jgi:isopentenyl phosphate kinase
VRVKNLTIIKIGGSVATFKEKIKPIFREKIVSQLAKEFSDYRDSHKKESFILVHGAGSFGHPLAKKYDLAN